MTTNVQKRPVGAILSRFFGMVLRKECSMPCADKITASEKRITARKYMRAAQKYGRARNDFGRVHIVGMKGDRP